MASSLHSARSSYHRSSSIKQLSCSAAQQRAIAGAPARLVRRAVDERPTLFRSQSDTCSEERPLDA